LTPLAVFFAAAENRLASVSRAAISLLTCSDRKKRREVKGERDFHVSFIVANKRAYKKLSMDRAFFRV
jgi:hypothetical protein